MERKIVKKDDVNSFVAHYLNSLLQEHLDLGGLEVFVRTTEIVAIVQVKNYEEVFAKLLSFNMPADISRLAYGYISFAYACKNTPACGKSINIGFTHSYEFDEDK